MKVHELINALNKVPNKNLDVQFARMSNSFLETRDFTEVIVEHTRCLLVKHIKDWNIVGEEEAERMRENHEIW